MNTNSLAARHHLLKQFEDESCFSREVPGAGGGGGGEGRYEDQAERQRSRRILRVDQKAAERRQRDFS